MLSTPLNQQNYLGQIARNYNYKKISAWSASFPSIELLPQETQALALFNL
jgi:hypothetical protein